MFVEVQLLNGYKKTLTYKIPQTWQTNDLLGSVIMVPLRNKIIPALVLETFPHISSSISFEIKEASSRETLPPDEHYQHFIEKVSQFYFVSELQLYQRIKSFLYLEKDDLEIDDVEEDVDDYIFPHQRLALKSVTLTDEQQIVVDYFLPYISASKFAPTLVHGVTGSGKTEIYKKVIEHTVAQQKTILLLLPEVSLALQFQRLLQKQLSGKISIFGFHSASKAKEKREMWAHVLAQKPCLIVGVHLPALLPIANLGCIIVDEEHESGFQEKKHPKINSKEIALWRAQMYNIPIMLGSATPSLTSLNNVKKNGWKLFQLTKRFSGTFPEIKIVEFDKQPRRQHFWITKELQSAITERLAKKEQTIIYLNRRGYSFFVQCKLCGYTFTCPHCSVSLTLHKEAGAEQLSCHYCDYQRSNPTSCEQCKAGDKDLLRRGVGTQQIVSILEQMFPSARIARADLDTTKQKRSWHETVDQFEKGELDILVGTQTITKGYHFPRVTLVGIIWADLNVHFPVFNASETALQQLIQVAGRAGRSTLTGTQSLVIAQIMHAHPIFKFLREEAYLNFCDEELMFRQETNYPPFGRLVHLELKHENPKILDDDAQHIYDLLHRHNEEKNLGISILGPTRPLVYKIQQTEMRHIFLKSPNFGAIYNLLNSITNIECKSSIFVVPTP